MGSTYPHRTKRFALRLQEAESEKILAAVSVRGVSISEWGRQVLLGEAERILAIARTGAEAVGRP